MDLLQIIGIVAIAWIAVSALVVALTAAAGRADTRERSLRIAARALSDTRGARARTRFVRRSQHAATVADHQSVPPGVHAVIR